jgi:phosphoglucosamine mutase
VSSGLSHKTRRSAMARQYFGTDGIRGTVGKAPITPISHCAWRMPWAACCADARASDGADRQGHPHLGLHAGSRAGSRFQSAGVDVMLLGRCPRPAWPI